LKLINKKDNIFGDDIAFVEQYDFSTANLNEENRIKAITTVASICYQNPKAVGSESLYNRLLAESKGLPSSSFEVVPVLLHRGEVIEVWQLIDSTIQEKDENGNIIASYIDTQTSNIEKYGEWIEVDGCKYLLTNFRAIVNDFEQYGSRGVDLRNRYNTLEECEIIKQHFKVFNFKVDLPTRSQMVRHRVSWQELSRRYVSGERVPFEFYISDKMKGVKQTLWIPIDKNTQTSQEVSTGDLINVCIRHYKQAVSQGVKPQEARRIIHQVLI
jgi:thymidylate synthase (FAD)